MNVVNTLDHPVDLPTGGFVPPGGSATVDPQDPHIAAYLVDGTLVESTASTEPPPEPDEAPARARRGGS